MTLPAATAEPAPLSRARWDEAAAADTAAAVADPHLGSCLYVSRLLGSDPGLVLHGGGNTSVKSELPDVTGAPQPVLWVKGSGCDLATVEARSFSPVALAPLHRLLALEHLDDTAMAREMRRATVDLGAPTPSVETLTHAALPHRHVLHAHPDAVLAATSIPAGLPAARRLFGPTYAVLPWVFPGFALARTVADLWHRRRRSGLRGIVLLHHGVLTFADDPRQAWQALLDCVALAASALPASRPREVARAPVPWDRTEIGTLRRELSRLAGRSMIVTLDDSESARHFAGLPAVAALVQRGPLTPDHVLRTKRTAALVPYPGAIRSALARFAHDYRGYFRRFAAGRHLTILDPAPRVVVAPGAGVFACGANAAEAAAALELWQHTMPAMLAAEELGGYRSLPARQIFELEYWPLEQEKLARRAAPPPLAGRVALVTGAAHGIGRASVDELLAQGAAVVGIDLDPTPSTATYLGITADVRTAGAIDAAVEATARRFGGLDLLISNVGVFPPSRSVDQLSLEEWRAVMEINATSHLALLRAAIPLLECAPAPASVVLIGSRNVLAPGPAAAAYSASKAALTQLARVAALELAVHGIRVNVLHPDGVFDTALWVPELLAERARRYRLSVELYRRRNLLHVEVKARDVARLAAAQCTELFACTTGAQIPVDGGNSRVV
jgi:rhamnose utilization protein RhaD (predicted bifunctional aldolase and dehydrogenase)/NAD(P)-dependent dehydrogenase (short-subunit alcohol dehydrogenase family)